MNNKENVFHNAHNNVRASPFDHDKMRQRLIDYSSAAASVMNDELDKAESESKGTRDFKADVVNMVTQHRQEMAFWVATKKERQREYASLQEQIGKSKKRQSKEKRRVSAQKGALRAAQGEISDLQNRMRSQKRNAQEYQVNRGAWEQACEQRKFTEQQIIDERQILQNELNEEQQRVVASRAEIKRIDANLRRLRSYGAFEADLPKVPRSPPRGAQEDDDLLIESWRMYKNQILDFFVMNPLFLPCLCHKYFDGPIIPLRQAEEIASLNETDRRERIEHIIVEHEIEHSGGSRDNFEAKRGRHAERMRVLAIRWHQWCKRHCRVEQLSSSNMNMQKVKVRFSLNMQLDLTNFMACFKLWRLQTLKGRSARQRELLLHDSNINAAASTVDFGSSIHGGSSQGGAGSTINGSMIGTATMNSLPIQPPTIHENSCNSSAIFEPLPSERDCVQVRRIMSARLPPSSISLSTANTLRGPSTARGSSAAPARLGGVRHASEARLGSASEARLGSQANPIRVSHSVPRAAHPVVARNMSSVDFRTMPATARTVRPSPLITSRQQPSSARMPSAPVGSLTRSWSTVQVPQPPNFFHQSSSTQHFPSGGVGVMRSATTGRQQPYVATTTRVPPPYPSFAGQVRVVAPPQEQMHASNRPLFVPATRQTSGPPPRVIVSRPAPQPVAQPFFKSSNAPIPPKRTISKPLLVKSQQPPTTSTSAAAVQRATSSSPFPQPSPCRPVQVRHAGGMTMRQNASERGMPRERIEPAVTRRESSLEQFVRPILDFFA